MRVSVDKRYLTALCTVVLLPITVCGIRCILRVGSGPGVFQNPSRAVRRDDPC